MPFLWIYLARPSDPNRKIPDFGSNARILLAGTKEMFNVSFGKNFSRQNSEGNPYQRLW